MKHLLGFLSILGLLLLSASESSAMGPGKIVTEAVKRMLKSDSIGCDPGKEYKVRGGRAHRVIDKRVKLGSCQEKDEAKKEPKKEKGKKKSAPAGDRDRGGATERLERMDRDNDRAERADRYTRTA